MIAVVDNLDVFRLLAKRRIKDGRQALLPYIDDVDIQTFSSAAELLSWLNIQERVSCQLLLLNYRFANGETIIKSLPDILHHPKMEKSMILGWSSTDSASHDFRQHGLAGFISKNRDESLVEGIIHIITQHDAGTDWIELF